MIEAAYREHQAAVEQAWKEIDQPLTGEKLELVRQTIALLDNGCIRVAECETQGRWRVNEWVKQAILLYFRHHPNRPLITHGSR